MDLQKLALIAIDAAQEAGHLIHHYFNQKHTISYKEGFKSRATQLLTEVDKLSEKIILKHLKPSCEAFDLGLLSEETVDDGTRFEKSHFWCIDPLDGTLPFLNREPGFSVSIALVSKNGNPIIGVVFDPITQTLYHAIAKMGAFRNGKKWCAKKKSTNLLTYVTDRLLEETEQHQIIEQFLDQTVNDLGLEKWQIISGGGAVLNAIRVIEYAPACMIKLPKKDLGGGAIWDYAATSCLFNELDMHATDYEHKSLDFNSREHVFMNKKGLFFSSF